MSILFCHDALVGFIEATKRYYPLHLLFARDIQILLDQYLRELRDFITVSLCEEIAQLPDNELHALMTREASELIDALARTENPNQMKAIKKRIKDNKNLTDELKLDESRRNDPLDMRQKKRVRRLLRINKILLTKPLLTPEYHSPPTAVQTPIHEELSSFIPTPGESEGQSFFLGGRLPKFLQTARRDYATLAFRSMLLFNESYQYTESIRRISFPRKSHSEILQIEDWSTRLWRPETWEDHVSEERGTSPGMVALALLADPLRMYRNVVLARPKLRVNGVDRVASKTNIKKFFAWRNTVFHVADSRVSDPERIELEMLHTSLPDSYRDIVSGLCRFFLRGDGFTDVASLAKRSSK